MDALAIAGWLFVAVIGLVAALYAVVLYELRTVRKKVHAHDNLLTRCVIVLQQVCHKVGVPWPKNKNEE